AGVDAFALTRNQQTQSQFDQQSLGGDFRVGYQISESLRQTLMYTLRTDRIYNVASTVSLFIKQEVGQRLTSAVGQVLLYDTRDGRAYYTGTAQLGFPLGLPQELGITGRVFTDVGSLFAGVETGAGVEAAASLRVSSGVGVSWASPLGPVRLDVGKPLVKEK